jgi:hypothetical protein
MKHAGPEAIDRLAPLLAQVRTISGTVEKKPGTFYRKSSALLHFHEDPAGLFADVKVNGSWERFRVETAAEQAECLAALLAAVAP